MNEPILKIAIIGQSKHPAVDTVRQLRLVKSNDGLINKMLLTKNITEWNNTRASIGKAFDSMANSEKTLLKVLFLGHIDGSLKKPFK